jgi:hypothetical protein
MPASSWRTVATVTAEDNDLDRVRTVGLAEDAQGAGGYLIFQASLDEPTEQDSAMGMDTYCVMDDEGGVHYGGVRHVELRDRELTIRFDQDAAAELSVQGTELRLALAVPDDAIDRLRTELPRVLTYGNTAQRPTLTGIQD